MTENTVEIKVFNDSVLNRKRLEQLYSIIGRLQAGKAITIKIDGYKIAEAVDKLFNPSKYKMSFPYGKVNKHEEYENVL